jgi:hypothetical protein
MVFQGSLAELHLPDIIQLVSVSGKTGVFHLSDSGHRGLIYLQEGRIVHAELEDAVGEEAVYALAIWSKGDFRFDVGVGTEHHTITKSNTNLLMEAARRLDEWRVLSKKVPSVELVPEFVIQENREGQINLNTSEWLILSKIDGRRSVKGIAGAAGLSVFDVAKMLYGLITNGLIRLRDTAPPSAANAPRPATPSTPDRGTPSVSPPRGTPVRGVTAAGAELVGRLDRVRDACKVALGSVAESVVQKHYQKARLEIERGAGPEAIEEAVNQITRAASILKGPAAAETLLEQLRTLR